MSEAAATLRALGEVYAAGAKASRRWPFNTDRQQDAEVYQAMADEADRQANLLEET